MRLLRDVWPAGVLALVLLLFWEAYCRRSGISPLVLPAPSAVGRGLIERWADLRLHALATLQVAALGFTLSAGFALAISVPLHFLKALRRALLPLFVVSQTIPLVALAPLMILWFGFGMLPKLLLVVLVTFFPILLSLLSGYARAPQDQLDLLASMGAGRLMRFQRVTFPSAREPFLAGLRISATYAIVATIFAEYAGARSGIGIYILQAKNNFRADLLLGGVLASALLTLGLLGLLWLGASLSDPRRRAAVRERRHARA